jgi:hypothetical protein
VRQVPLSQGLFAIVDDADAPRVSAYLWHARWNETAQTHYAQTNVKKDDGSSTTLQMHRFLMNAPDGVQVDHRNHDGLNNTRENLRLSTRGQNQHNRKVRKSTRSGFKGVSFHKGQGKWCAYINFEKKRVNLGYFTDAKDAARAYNAKARELFGEFASVNPGVD